MRFYTLALFIMFFISCGCSKSESSKSAVSSAGIQDGIAGPQINFNPWLIQLGTNAGAKYALNTSSLEFINAVTTDKSGNIYCTGSTFGSLAEPISGFADIFVMKLSPVGEILWVKQFGEHTKAPNGSNSGLDWARGIFVDNNNHIYISGETSGSMGEANGGGMDVLMMKLSSEGELLWLTQLGAITKHPLGNNSRVDQAMGITVDQAGNVFTAGLTYGPMGEAHANTIEEYRTDAFVVKLSSAGKLEWITQLGRDTKASNGSNVGDDLCRSIASDLEGNVYCAGQTSGNMGEVNGGRYDAFVLKLNSSGEIVWLTQLGQETAVNPGSNSGHDICWGVTVDNEGNVYCAGSTDGNIGEERDPLSGPLGNDAFVLKLNSSGEILWLTHLGGSTKSAGGSNIKSEHCNSVTVDDEQNVFCGGATTSSMGEIHGGERDAFVLKLNSAGELQWVSQLGGDQSLYDSSKDDQCFSVSLDVKGNIFCAGQTYGNLGDKNGGSLDAFIMKLNPEGKINI
jgi:hypothetical protein